MANSLLLQIVMDITRNILSCIMALLVSLPMCVCGHSFLATSIEEEHSCCPQNKEVEENNSDNRDHDCNSIHHDQVEYLSVRSEPNLPKIPEHHVSVDFIFSENISSVIGFGLGNYLRALPPDCFPRSSRNITYCIYRL